MEQVPVVDLSAPSSASLAALDAACSDHGFFLLEGHGLNDLVDRTWDATRRFFSAGPGVKEPIRRTAERAGLNELGPTALGAHIDPGVDDIQIDRFRVA